MKHHKYTRGWREWEEMTRAEFIRDLITMTLAYGIAFAVLVIVVRIFIHK